MPGQARQHVVIGGHCVSHDKPFRNIDQLVAGDPIVMTFNGVASMYIVTRRAGRHPQRHLGHQPDAGATPRSLFACHPPGSTKFRYVVFAKLAGT